MGQISLPRLHKLNSSVFFESIYLAKTEMWQSLKIYLFLSNFVTIFQFESILIYKYSWGNISTFSFINFNISKKFSYSIPKLSFTLQKNLFLTVPLVLNFYLTYIGGSYYGIIFLWPIVNLDKEVMSLDTKPKVLTLNTLLYY